MNVFKKSALSLAVAGVVCGLTITSVDAADVNIGGTQDQVAARNGVTGVTDEVDNSTDAIVVDAALETSAAAKNSLTVLTDDGNVIGGSSGAEEGNLDADLTVNAVVNGSANSGNQDGILIDGANALIGNVDINANVTGGAAANKAGLRSDVAITGDITIKSGVTVAGGANGDGISLQIVTGALTNSGTISTSGTGTALILKGVVSGGVTNADGATISSAGTAISFEESNTFTNSGTVTGAITAAADKTASVTNNGTITGALATGAGNVAVTNTDTLNINAASGTSTGNLTVNNTGTVNITAAVGAGGGTVTLNNTGGTTNVGASSTVDTVTNTGSGKVVYDAAANGATIALTVNEDFTNAATVEEGTGSDDTSQLIANKQLINSGTITVDSVAVTEAMTNTGTITTSVMNLTAASSNSGTINLSGAGILPGAGVLANTGTINFTADSTIADASTLTNTGNLYLAKDVTLTLTTGSLDNDGKLTAAEGSTVAGSLDSRGGDLVLVIQNSDFDGNDAADDLGVLLSTNTSITLNEGSSIVVSATEEVLKQVGETATAAVLVDADILGFDTGSATETDWTTNNRSVSVTSGNILLKLSNPTFSVGAADEIRADLEVISASDALGTTSNAAAKSLANDFSASTALTAAEQVVVDQYQSLESNATSQASLNEYLDKIRPDDSNSSASSVASMTNAAMGNITNRAAAKRGGNFGDMMASGSFWMQTLTGKGEQDAVDGALGYETKLTGFTFGVDTDWEMGTTGVAFSYGNTDVDFAGTRQQNEEIKSYVGSVYHNWQSGNMFVDASLSYGKSKHEAERMGGAALLKGDYDSSQIGAQVFVGMSHAMGDAMLEPKVGFRGTWVNTDDYTAKNSDSPLTEVVGDISYKKLELGLGATLSRTFEVDNGSVRPSAAVMYFHDTANEALDNTITFAGNTYEIKGNSPERGSWEGRLGLDMMSDSNLTFSVDYTRVHKDDFKSDNFSARLKYDF